MEPEGVRRILQWLVDNGLSTPVNGRKRKLTWCSDNDSSAKAEVMTFTDHFDIDFCLDPGHYKKSIYKTLIKELKGARYKTSYRLQFRITQPNSAHSDVPDTFIDTFLSESEAGQKQTALNPPAPPIAPTIADQASTDEHMDEDGFDDESDDDEIPHHEHMDCCQDQRSHDVQQNDNTETTQAELTKAPEPDINGHDDLRAIKIMEQVVAKVSNDANLLVKGMKHNLGGGTTILNILKRMQINVPASVVESLVEMDDEQRRRHLRHSDPDYRKQQSARRALVKMSSGSATDKDASYIPNKSLLDERDARTIVWEAARRNQEIAMNKAPAKSMQCYNLIGCSEMQRDGEKQCINER